MNWFGHILGIDNLSGAWYGFWSGFGSDLAYFGAIYALWRKHNCHQKRCWRIGRHPHGQWLLCARHHPAGAPTADRIEAAQQFQEQILAEVRELRHTIQRGGFGIPDTGKEQTRDQVLGSR